MVLIFAALTPFAWGQSSVTLAWDPSNSSSIAGYRLYEGIASRTYTNVIVAGKAATATFSGLVSGATYFFAVTAYDTNGIESDFSIEITYTAPLPTNNPPAFTVASTAPKLKISALPGVAIILGGIVQPPRTSIVLGATGQPGQTYDVVCSEDLKTWTSIGTLTLDASGSGTFTDPAGTSRPRRLYRLQAMTVTPPRLRIRASAAGPVILSGTGQAGQTYSVLCSPDLLTWTVIGTLTLDNTGSGQFTDPAASTRPKGMYRLQGQ